MNVCVRVCTIFRTKRFNIEPHTGAALRGCPQPATAHKHDVEHSFVLGAAQALAAQPVAALHVAQVVGLRAIHIMTLSRHGP